jgi:hypothetical protein
MKQVRERPFNLKGGGVCFFFYKNILIPNVAEKNILILGKALSCIFSSFIVFAFEQK